MSDDVHTLYTRLAGTFGDTVRAVPADRWDDPSPCEEWTARDVLDHVVSLQRQLLDASGAGAPDAPGVGEDPVGAWEATSEAVGQAMADPDVAQASFTFGPAGETSMAALLSTFGAVDMVVHRWDVARATGGDTAIGKQDRAFVWEFNRAHEQVLRSPGAFGAALEAAPDADDQDRLLAFLGRAS